MRNLKLTILAALLALVWTASALSRGQESMDIEDFVRQTYVHGIPYEEASRYDASVVPTLLKMLEDPKEQDHWSNIVVTLGMIGDESAVAPMIAFIESNEAGTPNRTQRRARTSAIMSLGYFINKSGSRKALDYLTTNLLPPRKTDKFAGAVPGQDGGLNKYAVLGLALSGHPQAAAALESIDQVSKSIRESPDKLERVLTRNPQTNLRETIREALRTSKETVLTKMSQSGVREMIGEALRTNKEIAGKGLAQYYRSSRP